MKNQDMFQRDIRFPGKRIIDGIQSIPYFAAMLGLLAAVGWLIAGVDGAIAAGIVPSLALLFVPAISTHAIMKMRRAVAIEPRCAPDLHSLLARLARRAGLERAPALYWHGSRSINAFTVGAAADAAVAVSEGALRHLSRRELEGVLAHEVAHIAAGDTRLAVLAEAIRWASSVVSALGLVLFVWLYTKGYGDYLPLWVPFAFALAPHAIQLLQFALSRRREFAADSMAAGLTHDPAGLASALVKIKQYEESLLRRLLGLAFPMVDVPFLRSHPSIEERVVRLIESAHTARPEPMIGTSPMVGTSMVSGGPFAPFGHPLAAWPRRIPARTTPWASP